MIALHIIDPSTAPDSLAMLATLIARSAGIAHHVLSLGHHAVGRAALAAGVPQNLIATAPSRGWADPAAWRAVRKHLAATRATHLHAWGITGAVAGTVASSFKGPRILSLANFPTPGQLKLLRTLTTRTPWAVTAASSSLLRTLLAAGLAGPLPTDPDTPLRAVRIRPGIVLKDAAGANRTALRHSLGITPTDGPVILLGGESTPAARHDIALWAIAILQEVFPNTRALVREPLHGFHHAASRARDFASTMAHPDIVRFLPPDLPWPLLVQAADIMLITPDAPIPTASILWAHAATLPVIGTATEAVSELIEHNETGLLVDARLGPRGIAARLEAFMADSTLRWPLTDKARANVFAHFKPAYMTTCFRAVYQQTLANPTLPTGLALPPPEPTAADRFATLVDLG